jgi:hypothetical protein
MSKYEYKTKLDHMLSQHDDKPAGISIPGWPVFWWIILCVGEPDLLDAIIKVIGGY